MTGVNPGKHSIFGFKEKVEGGYSLRLANNSSLKVKTLWKLLSEMGKRVVLINIPMTYPPEEIHGILIGGMDSPGLGSNFTFPPHIKEELSRVANDYVIHLHVGAGYLDSDAKRRRAVQGLLQMIEARERAVLHFMDHHRWDFFAVNFSAIDQVQHHFWRYMAEDNEFKEVILRVYQRVDEAVAKITARFGDETTLYVMSDHGAGPASDFVIFIDEWLRENGLLQFKRIHPSRFLIGAMADFLLKLLSKKLPSNIKDSVMRFFPGLRAKSQGFIRRSPIDWSRTKAYSGEHPATLRINLKRRDREGIVEAEEFETIRQQLIKSLEALEHPDTGDRLVEKVYRREEIYSGEYLDSAPDLVVWTKDFSHQIKGGPIPRDRGYNGIISRKAPKEFFVNGVHRLNGIFMAKGQNIRKNVAVQPMSIMDLYPTILHSLGMGIPKAIDGRVVTEIFEDEFLVKNPIRYIDYDIKRDSEGVPRATYETGEEKRTIEQVLKGLGYMD